MARVLDPRASGKIVKEALVQNLHRSYRTLRGHRKRYRGTIENEVLVQGHVQTRNNVV